jgi:hypothetical protein
VSTGPSPPSVSVPAWLRGFLDDAAVFPPENAPMADGVQAHVARRAEWYAELIGPFLCPASRLGELRGELRDPAPVAVSVVVDTGTGGVAGAMDEVRNDPRLVLCGLEIPLRGDDLVDSAHRVVIALQLLKDDLATYVDVPRLIGWRDALSVLGEHGIRAKFRTGGATADAFPSEGELAEFMVACLDNEVSFKLTAGLHHAVRHTAWGIEQHGFLNVLCATTAALDGGTTADVAAVLAIREPAHLLGLVDGGRFVSARNWFLSFGTCSIEEPLDDLLRLGLLQPAPPTMRA